MSPFEYEIKDVKEKLRQINKNADFAHHNQL
jgi:hypothetical protein